MHAEQAKEDGMPRRRLVRRSPGVRIAALPPRPPDLVGKSQPMRLLWRTVQRTRWETASPERRRAVSAEIARRECLEQGIPWRISDTDARDLGRRLASWERQDRQ